MAMSSDQSLRNNSFSLVKCLDGLLFKTAYEEHGLLFGANANHFSLGALIEIIPNHVCGAIDMWSNATLIRNEKIIGQ